MSKPTQLSLVGRLVRYLTFLLFFAPAISPSARAETIWNGPVITFSQPSPDPTQAINQDRLTSKVWLTRWSTQGIFNAVTESAYDKGINSDPTDTEWSYGNLANYASLTYTPWAQMSGNNPPSMVNQQAVVHLISDDIYISIKFLAWRGSAGGYAYARSTPGSAAPTVSITSPTNGATFAAPAIVSLAANATVSGGTVTNVTYSSGATVFGSATISPFSVTASNLPAGPYAVTAVATAGGLSATSAVVNFTVVNAGSILLSSPRIAANQFIFSYTANPGLSYVVQSSSTLSNWASLSTNVAAGSLVTVTNPVAASGGVNYRVGRLP